MARVHSVIDDGRRFYEDLLRAQRRAVGARRTRASATARSSSATTDGETELRGVPTVLAVGARPWIAPIPGLESTRRTSRATTSCASTDLPRSLVDRRRRADRLRVRAGAATASASRSRSCCAATRRCAARSPRRARRCCACCATRACASSRARAGIAVARRARRHASCSWIGGSVTAEAFLSRPGASRASTRPIPPRRASRSTTAARASTRHLETTARGIWALGDAIGGDHRRFQFTHVATYEGPQVAENALRSAHHEPAYDAMPRVTFTDPEVAAVGLTEAEARERGINVHAHVQARPRGRQGARDRRDRGLRQGRDRPGERQAARRDGHGRRTPATCSRR